MSTEKMREGFLAWWLDDFQRELRCSCAEGWAFHIWQASRAAIEVELPEGSSLFMRMYGVGCDRPLMIEREKSVKAIESLGLKVAP